MDDKKQTYERIITRKEFRELTGISRTKEWRLGQKGLLPNTIEVNARILGYLESSYIEWLLKHSKVG